jgi:hypothetical protein
MNNTTPNSAPPRWGQSPEQDAELHSRDANHLRNNLLFGLGTGVGIGGLYYLSQYLKDKTRRATHVPDAVELASAPITDVANPEPEEEPILPLPNWATQAKAAVDSGVLLFPAVGAGAGALIGAARANKGQKRKNALIGALLGAGGGLGVGAATSAPVWEAVSRNIPRNFNDLTRSPFGKGDEVAPAETWIHGGVRNTLGLTLPAAGAYGGLALANAVMEQESAKKNRDAVEAARREYFNALIDVPEPEEKSAMLDAFLDGAFVAYKESNWRPPLSTPVVPAVAPATSATPPSAPENSNGILQSLQNWWRDNVTQPADELGALGTGLLMTSGLGAGAIGAKYMYDKTKAQSAARNRERARAARERMRGLDAPWVDPRELADVKALAAAGGPAARGV